MYYTDLHIHILCGVDDGAKTEREMQQILDVCYRDGARVICATPHFHPGYFGNNIEAVKDAYFKLRHYAKKYRDLRVCLGNELRYSPQCIEWLASGACRELNHSGYVLVDFSEDDAAAYIMDGLVRIRNAGYVPILAHAERYIGFHRDLREVEQLRKLGVVIQVDAQSPFGGWGKEAKKRSCRILKNRWADLAASDAHNLHTRPPGLSGCYNYVSTHCGEDYAKLIMKVNPFRVLCGKDLKGLE